jgi:hypothetical protein
MILPSIQSIIASGIAVFASIINNLPNVFDELNDGL